jgi:predicted regulator of Ras-like GTPase activity (Roadblock/LC7/MglB family)
MNALFDDYQEVNNLQMILQRLQSVGGFKAVVLTSAEGLPLAGVSGTSDKDIAAAMAVMIQRVTREAREELGMAALDEVMLRDDDQTRLISRYFTVEGESFILAVLVPGRQPYRRLTNQTIRQVRKLLIAERGGG